MIRNTCVLCESKEINNIYTLTNYPITPSTAPDDYEFDVFKDCKFVACNICSCVQLETLIDPTILYMNTHNSTGDTPTWKAHHTSFVNFIDSTANIHDIVEIGGNSGLLYNYTKNKGVRYSIIDICDNPSRPSDIPFIQGNCETFDFTGIDCVVLSHTLEHLYNPRDFINNLRNGGVKSIFISIPNMNNLVATQNLSILHNEHTYFIGNDEILALFSQFGYSCAYSQLFKLHSYFYNFIYSPNTTPIQFNQNTERTNTIQNIFKLYETKMLEISITSPCFICPAGHYGQKIYYYLKKYSIFIQCFIDNDPSKQGTRVYGTPKLVHSPDIIQNYKDKKIFIILYAGPYSDELKCQLNLLHPSIVYITI